jgi:single-stranded-DNA-specific exonuclease
MTGLQPRYRWRLRASAPVSAELLDAGRRHGLSERLLGLIAARQHEAADLPALLGPPEAALHDPRLLPDADAAVARIMRARAAGEGVLIFGDFDADGLTGLAILTLALRRLGIDTEPYVPSREHEGHGLSARAVDRAAAEGRGLIITVDCGTASAVEIAGAASAGVEVIVTDHHHVPVTLPPAVAVVNPQRPDSRYPDARIAGSGVAFKLAQLLAAEAGAPAASALELTELAVIGAVADVAPMLGENRAIARLGLARLRGSPRPGLAALMEAAGLRPDAIDLEAIAFVIAPRLNAVGRLGAADAALRLLLTDQPGEAAELAAQLEAANLARRELTKEVLQEARAAADAQGEQAAVVVGGAWPVGIIGLVAGRLADERGRPAVVFSTLTEPWRGSARGPSGFHLADAFDLLGDLFLRHGGHAQAAGCSLRDPDLAAFRDRLCELVGREPAMAGRDRELMLDLALAAVDVDYRLHRELLAFQPTGPGHPDPLVGVADLVVTRVRLAAEDHAQLTVRKGLEVLDAICFDRADLIGQVREGDRIDVVARLASRTFGGFESLQLEVRDVGPAGTVAALREAARAA